jgi:two-component system alkaline phosphatase synthesis response regulator PhoP
MPIHPSILIADDEPDIREFISYNLTKYGYNVYMASNGHEAFELALLMKPNLIILDIMMPECNGFEASRKMRENKSLDHSRIFFLSAMSENMARTSGYQIFVDGFIPKPISIKNLLIKINDILSEIHD